MSTDNAYVRISKRTLYGTACFLAGGLIMTAGFSFADNLTSTQTVLGDDLVIPYDGFLMIDSAPLTGNRTIKFDLYRSSDAAATSVWSETQTVQLYGGKFSVGLGTSTSLTNTILDAEKLWLGMTIIESDAQGNTVEVELSGRQAIEPAPFAAWAGNSADFNVAGMLGVAGDVAVGGGASFGDDVSISGSENDGTVAALAIGAGSQLLLMDGNEVDTIGQNLNLQNNSGNGTIVHGYLNAKGAVYLGDSATDDTTVSGDLTVDNNLSVTGTTLLKDTLTLQDNLQLTGAIMPYYKNWSSANTGDGGAAIVNDSNSFKALMIVGNDSSVNGTGTAGDRKIKMYDNVDINSDLQVGGDITISGDITNFSYTGEYRVAHSNANGYNNRTGTQCHYGNDRNSANASCSNSSAGSAVDMGSTTNRVCFLTVTGFQDVDGGDERGICSVYESGNKWYLVATAETGDANVWCNARCLSW